MRRQGLVVVIVGLVGCGAAAWLARPLLADRLKTAVENHLRENTGLPWRVRGGVDLAFTPEPSLVLHDVTAGSEGSAHGVHLTVAELRLSGGLGLALTGSGAGHAVAAGIAANMPLDGTAGSAPAAPSASLASLRGLVKGFGTDLDPDGHALAIHAETADMSFDLAPQSVASHVEIGVDGAEGLVKIALDHELAAADSTLRLTLEPASSSGHHVTATASVLSGPAHLKLDVIRGTVDGKPFSGTATLDWSAKPAGTADLHLARLVVADDAHLDDERRKNKGPVVPSSTLFTLDPRWLAVVNATTAIDIDELALGETTLHRVAAGVRTADAALDVTMSSEDLYEGGVRARYVLVPDQSGGRLHQLSLSLTRSRLALLLGDAIGVHGLDGIASTRIDAQATGSDLDAVLRSAAGQVDFAATDGWIDGLDVVGLAALLPAPQGSGTSHGALATRFSQLAASFTLRGGKATTNDLRLESRAAEVTGEGFLDLIGKTLDLTLKPSLGPPGNGQANRMTIPVHVVGPWSQPTVTADLSSVAAHPDQAIQSLQDLGSGLLDTGTLSDLFGSLPGTSPRNAPRNPRPQLP